MNIERNILKITCILEARGVRIKMDELTSALRDGAMALPGSIILMLIDSIETSRAALQLVPIDWPMSNAELAEAGII
jgi:hypothetical protein